MRKVIPVLLFLLATQSGWAGVQYEFIQSTQSDIEQSPPTHLQGRAIIDGPRSRVEFTGGNIYAPGAYVLSTNGSRTLLFVDPLTKSYSEIDAAAIAVGYGANNVAVTNLKTNLQKLGDQESVAGIPTTHYHLLITYELTLTHGGLSMKQNVREDIDKWTTTRFGDVAENFFAGGSIRTGNPELDKVIDAETTMIQGFPLREKRVISTTNTRGTLPGSKIPLQPVRTQQRELQIQSIHLITADPSLFRIPLTFQKIDASQQANLNKQPPVTILDFEDKTKKP